MQGTKIAGLVLLAVGALALVYGGFTYTKGRSNTDVGPFQISVTDREYVGIPVWAGVGAIVIGGILLVGGGRGRS
ncbi:MAG: hypothetical protein ABR565_03180 [Gammaproteobacteria bacterium]